MANTENLDLVKPDYDDVADIKDINDNSDKIDTAFGALLSRAYPVGSIYMSVVNTNPGTLFGGTWTQLKDRFLIGAGDSYSAGGTGGAATKSYTPAGSVGNHALTTSEIPAHNHGLNSHTHSVGAHSHGLNSHTHSVGAHNHSLNGHTHTIGRHNHGLNKHFHSVPQHTHGLNSHTHTVPNHTHGVSNGANTGFVTMDTSRDIYSTNLALISRGSAGASYYASYCATTASSGGAVTSGASGSTAFSSNFNTGQATGVTEQSDEFDSGKSSGNTGYSSTFNTGGASGNTANSSAFNTGAASGNTANTGSSGAHNHSFTGTAASINVMPPYLVVYMWKRVS